ncbi:unnamed protein product [Diplocarpon coronariae]
MYNTKGLELISRYINKIVDNSYSSYKNVDKYTSAIQSSSIYLRQLKCPLPKPIIASLIFKGLLSSFDSFAFRKYKEISSDLEHIDLESLINDLILEEYCTHYKLSGHISEKCYKLYLKLRPFNKKANKAKESKSNSSKTLISAWNKKAKEPKNDSSKTLISVWKKDSTTSIVSHLSELSQVTSIDNMKFILDSRAIKYYSPNKNWLINYKPVSNKAIIIANSKSMPILGKGDIPIKTKKGLNLLIEGVNLIPGLNTTLISSRELTKKDWSIDNDYFKQKLYQANTLNDIELYYKWLLYFNKELILKTVDNSIGLKKIQDTKLELDYDSYISAKIIEKGTFKLDNASEFKLEKWANYCKNKGYINEYTSPYSPSQNGIAERLNRFLIERLISNKLAEKSDKGILIGFESLNNFLIYVPKNRAIISSKNVIIKENLTYSTPTDKENSDYTDFIKGIENTIDNNRVLKRRGKAKDYSDYTPNVTTRAMANKYSNLAITNNRLIEEEIKALSAFKNATQLASQAFISYKADLSENIYSKPKLNAWEILPYEANTPIYKPLKTRWVYKIKVYKEYYEFKARFIAKGFEQLYGLNYIDTFASVIKQMAWRLIFALAIYIAPLNGIYTSKYSNKLLKLNKALYGLKQSARLWFITLKELNIIICVYIDDLALIGPNINLIKSFIKGLEEYFKLKDLGPIKDYLEAYITKLLTRFDMLAGKLKNIPIEPKIKLEPNLNKATSILILAKTIL